MRGKPKTETSPGHSFSAYVSSLRSTHPSKSVRNNSLDTFKLENVGKLEKVAEPNTTMLVNDESKILTFVSISLLDRLKVNLILRMLSPRLM